MMKNTSMHRLPRWPAMAMLALLLPLAGCGGSPSGGAGGGGGSAAGGKTLTVATAEDVQSLDPGSAYDTWSTTVVHAFTRRLVDWDETGKLVPDLAERWEASADGKTYTFHLRSDAKFSDGTAVEAGHFKAALDRVRDPKTASKGMGFYSGITSVEAPDATTLVVKLKAADPLLPQVMGLTFAAPIKTPHDPQRPASSGPYALQSTSPIVLTKNPHDTRNTSTLERITVQTGVDEALQMTRFQTGEVDLLPGIPVADYARVMEDPVERARVVQEPVNQTWYFGMNVTRPPWSNPKVRRAALLAMNRQAHVELAGAGRLANGILPPRVPGHHTGRALPAQNVAEAKRLLAEAGFPNGLPATMRSVMWLSNSTQYKDHGQAIQSDLAAVGIPVELRPVALSQYLKGYRDNADCWYGGWYPDFPDAGNFLEPVLHSRGIGSNNAARYRNPKVDQLLDRAHGMAAGPERDALYRQAEDLILQDLPWIPLYFEVETRYFREGVSGVKVHPVWRQMLTGIDKR